MKEHVGPLRKPLSLHKRTLHQTFISAFALMSTACAPIESLDGRVMSMRSPDFRDYVEQVFRIQNRTADAIAFALDEPDRFSAVELERLEEADTSLFEACLLLNELALRRRDGIGRRLLADARAARTAPECEAAAARGRAALVDLGVGVD